jgi:PhnB protein
MKITAYLTFDGRCEAAMQFYAAVFGVPVAQEIRFKEMPELGAPEHYGEYMAHMTINLDPEHSLYASDTIEEWSGPYSGVEGAALHVSCATAAEAEALFAKLSEGGSVTMPLTPMSWSELFGMCRDKFGVGWMVDYAGYAAV